MPRPVRRTLPPQLRTTSAPSQSLLPPAAPSPHIPPHSGAAHPRSTPSSKIPRHPPSPKNNPDTRRDSPSHISGSTHSIPKLTSAAVPPSSSALTRPPGDRNRSPASPTLAPRESHSPLPVPPSTANSLQSALPSSDRYSPQGHSSPPESPPLWVPAQSHPDGTGSASAAWSARRCRDSHRASPEKIRQIAAAPTNP